MKRSGYFRNQTVTTASTLIVPSGVHRLFLLVSNPTTSVLFISIGIPAALNKGIVVPPNTKPARIYVEEIGGLLQGGVFGVMSPAGGTVGLLVGYDADY